MSPTDAPSPPDDLTFAADIKPLFRPNDRIAMKGAFDLWSYDDVRAHAAAIGARLADGTMPCDGPWPAEQVAIFNRWLAGGARP
jgi:hypothetical protein